ncbi:MAG: macro domain-containing protein [candidate division Zixibacteria bacterium]
MLVKIEVIQADITKADTEAIVNAANNEFWMGAGVAGAIKSAGGDVIEEEAMRKGPVMPGKAIYTGAGRLPFKCVIHAAVMGQNLKTTDKLIRQSTIASLQIAEKLKISSVSFPAFGTGVGGFPIKACANIMTTTVNAFSDSTEYLNRVQFCLFDEVTLVAFREALKKRSY